MEDLENGGNATTKLGNFENAMSLKRDLQSYFQTRLDNSPELNQQKLRARTEESFASTNLEFSEDDHTPVLREKKRCIGGQRVQEVFLQEGDDLCCDDQDCNGEHSSTEESEDSEASEEEKTSEESFTSEVKHFPEVIHDEYFAMLPFHITRPAVLNCPKAHGLFEFACRRGVSFELSVDGQ
jgi:hypothetical protein